MNNNKRGGEGGLLTLFPEEEKGKGGGVLSREGGLSRGFTVWYLRPMRYDYNGKNDYFL